jgi:hypothetical protein
MQIYGGRFFRVANLTYTAQLDLRHWCWSWAQTLTGERRSAKTSSRADPGHYQNGKHFRRRTLRLQPQGMLPKTYRQWHTWGPVHSRAA